MSQPSYRADLNHGKVETVRFLDPKKLRFFGHGASLRMTLDEECSYLSVTVARLFPLSRPWEYLCVRADSGLEIGVITSLAEVEEQSRRMVEQHLGRRTVVPVIHKILSAKERFGVVEWQVETDRGPRQFTTRNLREQVIQPSPGRFLFSDVDGNRYDVPDVASLDPASRAQLMLHL